MKFDVALKVKIKNGVLQAFIDHMGWTQSDFAKAVGCSPQSVGRYFDMTDYPHRHNVMIRIIELVGKTAEEIFPDLLRKKDWLTGMRTFVIHREVDLEMLPIHRLKAIASTTAEIDAVDMRTDIEKALDGLTPREKDVIRMRYGIGHAGTCTMEEIADDLGVTRERVRQIESKAILKMRRGKLLDAYIDD